MYFAFLEAFLEAVLYVPQIFPASILYKSIAGCYWPVRVADGPITARYRFIKNAYWVQSFTCSYKPRCNLCFKVSYRNKTTNTLFSLNIQIF